MFFCLPKSCSQTNTWNPSPIPCHPTKTTNFQAFVFCRRAIHWYSEEQTTLYFNVEKACFNPVIGHASVFVNPYDISYFGRSTGHLRINTTSRQQQNWKCWSRRKITLNGQYRSWWFKSTHYFLVGKRVPITWYAFCLVELYCQQPLVSGFKFDCYFSRREQGDWERSCINEDPGILINQTG